MQITDLLKETLIFNTNLFSEILYTDTNPAVIETLDIKKVQSKIVKLTNRQEFQLKNFDCNNNNINDVISSEIINVAKSTQSTSTIEIPKRKWWQIFRNSDVSYMSKFSTSSWIITSQQVVNKLPLIKEIYTIIDDSIENEIYTGEGDSFGIIINKNITRTPTDFQFQLLIYNRNIRRIVIE